MISIAVCIACFNRRERTLACLNSLFAQDLPEGTKLVVHLLDDGSSDGTSAAVVEQFPQVRLHQGNGNLFWAGGMRVSYGAALAEEHEFYVWLNDDVWLFPDTLKRAIETQQHLRARLGGEHLVVGAMCASDLTTTTYSGFVRASAIFPWKFRRVPPANDRPVECDTLNGNFVVIPAAIAQRLGNIDPGFIQMHADIVLGLRARRAGARNWIMARFAGVCEANAGGRKDWLGPQLTFADRLARMQHPLGYPIKASIAYSRHFGVWAPVMVAAPYLNLFRAALSSWCISRFVK